MRKKQDRLGRASALQVALALALTSILTVLVASSFARIGQQIRPAQGQSAYAFQGVNAYTGDPIPKPDEPFPIVVTATGGDPGPTSYLQELRRCLRRD